MANNDAGYFLSEEAFRCPTTYYLNASYGETNKTAMSGRLYARRRHVSGIRMLGRRPFVRTEGINPSAHCDCVVGANLGKRYFKTCTSG
jgi:hypothetical protein